MGAPDETLDNEFWRFAKGYYARPGVSECALRLQDEAAANVNVLLWCEWLEAQSLVLGDSLLEEGLAAIAEWDRELVQELRALRRRLPAGDPQVAPTREKILAAELAAEQRVIAKLYTVTCAYLVEPGSMAASSGGSDRGANASRYLKRLGLKSEEPLYIAWIDLQ